MNPTTTIPTQTTELVSANILEVEAGGTQGGGDAGHGGRTYLRLKDQAGTAWSVRVTHGQDQHTFIEDPNEIEIWLGGDTEQETFVAALRFAADAIDGRSFLRVTQTKRSAPW